MTDEPKIIPDHPCLACGKPLKDDLYAQENEFGCCKECCDTTGTMFEVFTYFLVPLDSVSLPFRDGDMEWPHSKDPALYHSPACRLYPGWSSIVHHAKQVLNRGYFGRKELVDLINFLRGCGYSDEQIVLMKRTNLIAFLKAIKAAPESAAILQRETAIEREREHVVVRK